MAKLLKDVLESFEFNRAALAKQRLQNVRHLGRKVRGARIANLMRAAGLKEEEMEESELDQLDEVLAKDAAAGDWIHDFVHSTNPKFEGKTKKERIKMALGAYYGKQNEETELEESRYGRSSSYQRDYDSSRTGFGRREREDDEYHVPDPYIPPARPAPTKPPAKPEEKKSVKEEAEQIDELSVGSLKSYIKAAKASKKFEADTQNTAMRKDDHMMASDAAHAVAKRKEGIKTAKAKLNNEEVDLEEGLGSALSSVFQKMKSKLSPSTKPSNPPSPPAAPSKPNVHAVKQDLAVASDKLKVQRGMDKIKAREKKQDTVRKVKSAFAAHDAKKAKEVNDRKDSLYGAGNRPKTMADRLAAFKANNKAQGLSKSTNEEYEMNEAKDTVTKDASGKIVSFKHEGDWKKTPAQHKDQFGNTIKTKNVARNLARQGMQQAMKEEHGIDITDEDADTIVEGVLGALAGGTLAALATGPVGALAGAYLGHKVQQGANAKKKLADKQQKEEVELEEEQYAGLEKEDKKGLPTAMVKKSKKAVAGDTVEGWDHPHNAVQKESYDEEGNLKVMPKTFTEFMEGMTATKVAPGVTRYTGGSYGNAKGAKYGNTDYDKETLDTKDDEGSEEQKRGRGRPAGSKSGARGPRIK